MLENEGGQNELPTACGKMTDEGGINFYCAYESLMKQHGVPEGKGCAKDIVTADGKEIDMEICYCVSDGCNKNCSCSSENLGTASDAPIDSATTVQSANFARTSLPGSASSIEASGLVIKMIIFLTITKILISGWYK